MSHLEVKIEKGVEVSRGRGRFYFASSYDCKLTKNNLHVGVFIAASIARREEKLRILIENDSAERF